MRRSNTGLIATIAGIALAASLNSAGAGAAELEVKINARTPSVTVQTPNGPVEIKRNQDTEATINPKYAKTSRKCPPFCIQPMEVAPGVPITHEGEQVTSLSLTSDEMRRPVSPRLGSLRWQVIQRQDLVGIRLRGGGSGRRAGTG